MWASLTSCVLVNFPPGGNAFIGGASDTVRPQNVKIRSWTGINHILTEWGENRGTPRGQHQGTAAVLYCMPECSTDNQQGARASKRQRRSLPQVSEGAKASRDLGLGHQTCRVRLSVYWAAPGRGHPEHQYLLTSAIFVRTFCANRSTKDWECETVSSLSVRDTDDGWFCQVKKYPCNYMRCYWSI